MSCISANWKQSSDREPDRNCDGLNSLSLDRKLYDLVEWKHELVSRGSRYQRIPFCFTWGFLEWCVTLFLFIIYALWFYSSPPFCYMSLAYFFLIFYFSPCIFFCASRDAEVCINCVGFRPLQFKMFGVVWHTSRK